MGLLIAPSPMPISPKAIAMAQIGPLETVTAIPTLASIINMAPATIELVSKILGNIATIKALAVHINDFIANK